MSRDVGHNLVYARKEGCIVHPDDLELCNCCTWDDARYLEVLQEYHSTVTDVRKFYCSRPHLLKEISKCLTKI